jgi:hypothetical protein
LSFAVVLPRNLFCFPSTIKSLCLVWFQEDVSLEVAAVALNRYDLVKKLIKDGYFDEKDMEVIRMLCPV